MRSIRATGSRQQHVAHAAMLPLLLLLLAAAAFYLWSRAAPIRFPYC